MAGDPTKHYLNVPFHHKKLAKELGAMWDPDARRWYVIAGSNLALIFSWRKASLPLPNANDAQKTRAEEPLL